MSNVLSRFRFRGDFDRPHELNLQRSQGCLWPPL